MRLMVIAAHVDDEAILCGGTLHKAALRGNEAFVVFCSRNEQGRTGSESIDARRCRAEAEAAVSAQLLGFTGWFLPFEDMHLADQPGRLLESLITAIREARPDVVVTHTADWHSDHRAVATAVPEAALQAGYALAGSASPWRPSAVLQGEVDLESLTTFTPQVVSSLEPENIEAKLKAIEGYRSLTADHGIDGAVLRRLIEARASTRGRPPGATFGEAFTISPLIRLDAAALRAIAEIAG